MNIKFLNFEKEIQYHLGRTGFVGEDRPTAVQVQDLLGKASNHDHEFNG